MLRQYYTNDASGKQVLVTDRDQIVDDALGGRAYYLGKLELEIPLGAGARELGLRPSIYAQVGSLFNITRPLPTATFPTTTDAAGNTIVLPLPQRDTAGNPLFTYVNAGGLSVQTSCAAGIPDASGACNGVVPNSPLIASQPFKETFLGNSAQPRVSVGIGVNWNSPFGPLRIDLAKALVTQPGDDKKLVTFNVGTQF